jgi:hypothetical protein
MIMTDDDLDDEYDRAGGGITERNDLSEIELKELEEKAIQELREEGLLRPILIKAAEHDAETDSADDDNPPGWPNSF